MLQQTLVLIKPDGVARHLVGRIISRLEDAGLDVVQIKMFIPSAQLADAHYPATDSWYVAAGSKTLESYASLGVDAVAELGTDDPLKIGKLIKTRLVTYLSSGPVVAMILQGNDAVRNVRRLVGATLPDTADPGSIRGAFSIDSAQNANAEGRPVLNLVHASGEHDEALAEIALWFPEHHPSS